jgi:hypothetical protein
MVAMGKSRYKVNSPDNVVRIQKSVGVNVVVGEKSNPVKSPSFPSGAV